MRTRLVTSPGLLEMVTPFSLGMLLELLLGELGPEPGALLHADSAEHHTLFVCLFVVAATVFGVCVFLAPDVLRPRPVQRFGDEIGLILLCPSASVVKFTFGSIKKVLP